MLTTLFTTLALLATYEVTCFLARRPYSFVQESVTVLGTFTTRG